MARRRGVVSAVVAVLALVAAVTETGILIAWDAGWEANGLTLAKAVWVLGGGIATREGGVVFAGGGVEVAFALGVKETAAEGIVDPATAVGFQESNGRSTAKAAIEVRESDGSSQNGAA